MESIRSHSLLYSLSVDLQDGSEKKVSVDCTTTVDEVILKLSGLLGLRDDGAFGYFLLFWVAKKKNLIKPQPLFKHPNKISLYEKVDPETEFLLNGSLVVGDLLYRMEKEAKKKSDKVTASFFIFKRKIHLHPEKVISDLVELELNYAEVNGSRLRWWRNRLILEKQI